MAGDLGDAAALERGAGGRGGGDALRGPAQRGASRWPIPPRYYRDERGQGPGPAGGHARGGRAPDHLQLHLRDLRHADARAHGRGPPAGPHQPLRRHQAGLRARAARPRARRAACGRWPCATSTPPAATPTASLGEDHHPEEHLIPLAIDAALGRGRGLTIYGNDYDTPDGTCIRDYVHVQDLARAHVLALERRIDRGERLPGLQPGHRRRPLRARGGRARSSGSRAQAVPAAIGPAAAGRPAASGGLRRSAAARRWASRPRTWSWTASWRPPCAGGATTRRATAARDVVGGPRPSRTRCSPW